MRPTTITHTTAAPTCATTDAYLCRTSRTRPTGRVRRCRGVAPAAPAAMGAADRSEVPRGRKKGWMRTITVRAASIPLCRSWSKNNGPPLSWEDVARTTTGRIANPARPRANTHVRTRWRALPTSTRNIGALHQLDEDVLQALLLRDQGAHGDAARDQSGVQRSGRGGRSKLDSEAPSLFRIASVERGPFDRSQDGPGFRLVVHLDPELIRRWPELRRRAIGHQPSTSQHSDAIAHGFDLPQQVARHEDRGPRVGQPAQQEPNLPHALWVEAVGGLG